MKPTEELYQSLQLAYQHFNRTLFDDRLPPVLFTVQRQHGVLGYFAPDRWTSMKGQRCHEIAINPSHMGDSRLVDVLQTLVHEMVHCWQHCYGDPPRSCYHNKEWAYKMMAIGLQPTATGKPGGAITGQHMSDMPIKDGAFLKSCYALLESDGFIIPWIDRRSTPTPLTVDNGSSQAPSAAERPRPEESLAEGSPTDDGFTEDQITALLTQTYSDLMPAHTFYQAPVVAKSKRKYQCPSCRQNVWGKPGLHIVCGDCEMTFEFCD